MDIGILTKMVANGGGDLRDKVLIALVGVSATAQGRGRLNQARILSMRVGDVDRLLEGLPLYKMIRGVIRRLVADRGLSDADPVLASRKRAADGTRRPISRIQAYRILRARVDGGWAATVHRLMADRPRAKSGSPAAVAPSSGPPPRVGYSIPLFETPPPQWVPARTDPGTHLSKRNRPPR